MLLKDGQQSGGGSILFLSDAHDFQVKMGFGQGTNNQEELLSCKNLMLFTLENGCTQIHVFRDSMFTINCLNKTQVCRNILFMPILEETMCLIDSFISFTCCCIYRERNRAADHLPKEGLDMDQGLWV